jgi:P pilus assembly chaperone PapD
MIRVYCFLALLLAPTLAITARADLQITPTRLSLSDSTRTGALSLRHDGKSAGAYRISATFLRMDEQGGLSVSEKPESEPRSLVPLLHFSPKEISLKAGEAQTIRVRLESRPGLAEGDYRAHVVFVPAESKASGSGTPPPLASAAQGAAAQISIAIPIVYRHGNGNAEVRLEGLKLIRGSEGGPEFRLQMLTRGNGFPYGDFVALWSAGKQAPLEVGRVNGVSSYRERRQVSYPLSPPKGVVLSHGKLRLEYRESGASGKLLASVETEVP